MPQLTSKDGTTIAHARTGEGPPLDLVGGGLGDGSENAPLVDALELFMSLAGSTRPDRT